MQRIQFNKWGCYPNLFLSVLIMLFLTACSQTSKHGAIKDYSKILHNPDATFPVDTKISIGNPSAGKPPKSVNHTLEAETRLEEVLNAFGAVGGNLGAKVKNLKEANGIATTGVGGIFGHIFLDEANGRLTGDNWNSNVSVTQDVLGQITNYEFNADGSGLFHVTTLVTTSLRNPGNSNDPPTVGPKVAYHWQVEVDPMGFSVKKNCHKFLDTDCTNGDQPFPGTMDLDPSMLQTVIDRNFHYKLWAKGTKIKVKKVYRRMSPPGQGIPEPPPPTGNPAPWRLLEAVDNRGQDTIFKGLYETSDESCIDMMTIGYPPSTFANLPPVPFYCLGRCEQPFIVNSR